jgi:flagellar M-ring protein FliF
MDPAIDTVSIGIAINDPAMTPVARENLVQLVAFAAGVPPQSVTVRNFEFAQAEEEVEAEPLLTPQQLLVFGGIGAGVLLLLLVLLFVLTRGKKKKADGKTKKKSKRGKKGIEEAFASDEDAETDALFGALAADRSESIEPIHPVKDDKKEKVKEFAATNPEIAAQLFKSWLKNESE